MKFLSKLDSAKDIVTKEYVDSKTDVIYTVVGDDFADGTKIQTSTNVVVDNGALRVRPSNYSDDFSSKTFVDEDLTSMEVDIVNGVADVVSGTVGYDGLTGQIAHVLTSEPYVFTDSVTQFKVTANFNDNLGNLTGFETTMKGLGTFEVSVLTHQINDNGTIYEMYWNRDSSTTFTIYNGTLQYTYSKTAYIYTESDTLVRNVMLVADADFLYAFFPVNATSYSVRRIRKSNMTEEGPAVTFNFGVTTAQKIDVAITNASGQNRLHIVLAGTITNNLGVYNCLNLDSWGNWVYSSNTTLSTGSTGYVSVRLAPCTDANNQTRIGFTVFRSVTTSAVVYGILSTIATGTSATFLVNATTITTGGESTNGNGILLYNPTTTTFYAISARNSAGGVNYLVFNTSGTILLNNFTGTAPFNSIGFRFMDGIIESASRIHLFFATASRTTNANYTYGVISLQNNTFSIVSSIPNFIGGGGIAFGLDFTPQFKFIQTSNSPFLFRVYENSRYYNYTNNIKPTLSVSLRNQANQSISSTTNLTTSNNSATWSVTAISAVRVRFEFIYPIYTANFSGTVYSVDLLDYAIEQLTPLPTYPEGYFESIPLLTDRPISKVVLEVDQTIGSAGNNLQWWVFSNSNTFKQVNAANNWTAEFTDNEIGSTLQVKVYLNNAQSPSSIQNARIHGYKAYVYNVVTRTDFLALQVNMMKLGLQVGTWTASQRTGFTKMMIDTFTNGDGVTGMTPSNGVITGTGVATSVAESTDGNIFPSQILVVDDMNSTGTITYEVKRNNGAWESVIPNAIYTFQNGTPQAINQVQIRASLTSATLAGWAYIYA